MRKESTQMETFKSCKTFNITTEKRHRAVVNECISETLFIHAYRWLMYSVQYQRKTKMDTSQTSSAAAEQAHSSHRNKNKSNQSGRKRVDFNSRAHSFNKRGLSKPSREKCDIYVSNKSNFKVKKTCMLCENANLY